MRTNNPAKATLASQFRTTLVGVFAGFVNFVEDESRETHETHESKKSGNETDWRFRGCRATRMRASEPGCRGKSACPRSYPRVDHKAVDAGRAASSGGFRDRKAWNSDKS